MRWEVNPPIVVQTMEGSGRPMNITAIRVRDAPLETRQRVMSVLRAQKVDDPGHLDVWMAVVDLELRLEEGEPPHGSVQGVELEGMWA